MGGRTVGQSLLALELWYASVANSSARCDGTYGRRDGSIVGGGALGGEVDAVGSLELDLKSSCGVG